MKATGLPAASIDGGASDDSRSYSSSCAVWPMIAAASLRRARPASWITIWFAPCLRSSGSETPSLSMRSRITATERSRSSAVSPWAASGAPRARPRGRPGGRDPCAGRAGRRARRGEQCDAGESEREEGKQQQMSAHRGLSEWGRASGGPLWRPWCHGERDGAGAACEHDDRPGGDLGLVRAGAAGDEHGADDGERRDEDAERGQPAAQPAPRRRRLGLDRGHERGGPRLEPAGRQVALGRHGEEVEQLGGHRHRSVMGSPEVHVRRRREVPADAPAPAKSRTHRPDRHAERERAVLVAQVGPGAEREHLLLLVGQPLER